MGGPGAPGTEDTGDFSDGEGDLAANTAAQAAARAAFAEDKAADTFYSSDEDESEDKSSVTGSFVSASAGSTSEPSKKFKVVIKVSSSSAACALTRSHPFVHSLISDLCMCLSSLAHSLSLSLFCQIAECLALARSLIHRLSHSFVRLQNVLGATRPSNFMPSSSQSVIDTSGP